MIALLLRLYPARWRARYGDEFAAVLENRPLGPFDVADVLLGALDAHLHLRGLGAASQHAKGFAMSLRIGGYAAILGGILLFTSLGAGQLLGEGAIGFALIGVFVATIAVLVALVGLSAFQARRFPRLVWAAFAIPALGACISLVGLVGMATNGDLRFIGDMSAWCGLVDRAGHDDRWIRPVRTRDVAGTLPVAARGRAARGRGCLRDPHDRRARLPGLPARGS